MAADPSAPPDGVLAAFGCDVAPMRLAGGQGGTWRSGEVILKPTDNPDEIAWLAGLPAQVEQAGFRIARCMPAASGAWVVGGWFAQAAIAGDHAKGRWREVLAACDAFHAAAAHLPRPAFLDARTDSWAVADRVAWQEAPLAPYPAVAPALSRLSAALTPVDLPSQVIHGDFGGNVLFAAGLAPGVIDIAPYWRPAGFAAAVVVVDAIVWEGAGPDLLDAVAGIPQIGQLLLCAEFRRIMELDGQLRQRGRDRLHDIQAHLPLVDLLCARFG